MSVLESLRLAFRALTANKLRAALTMLGIIIGVGAVITLMSAGEGVSVYIEDQFQGMGSNLLFVIPGSMDDSGPPGMGAATAELTNGDVEAMRDPLRAPDVAALSPERMRSTVVATGKRDTVVQVLGVTPAFFSVRNWPPEVGRAFDDGDMVARSRVTLLGRTVVEDLFPDNPYPLEQTVKVNGMPFRVIGVLEEKGGSQMGDEDNTIVIPLSTVQTRLFPSRSRTG
ncbi:MAG: ABC transporter permease, partial [bacterium]|nr:ABC transporter permease [bacterium]